jgi:propionate CoA-transferase
MDLKRELLHLDLPERIALDATTGRLFINFEKMRIRSLEEIEQVRGQVMEVCGPLTDKVDVVVNYDGFQLDDDIAKDYAEMVVDLESRFYKTVTRYSGSAFMRLKLGETLPSASPHIFETREAAQAFLDRLK